MKPSPRSAKKRPAGRKRKGPGPRQARPAKRAAAPDRNVTQETEVVASNTHRRICRCDTAPNRVVEVAPESEATAEPVMEEVDSLAKALSDEPAKPASKKTPKLDDLKIMEGIGPKIEQLLKDGGIATWEALAECAGGAPAGDPRGRRFALPDARPEHLARPGPLRRGRPVGRIKRIPGNAHRRPQCRRPIKYFHRAMLASARFLFYSCIIIRST